MEEKTVQGMNQGSRHIDMFSGREGKGDKRLSEGKRR